MFNKTLLIAICLLFSLYGYTQSLSARPDERLKHELTAHQPDEKKLTLLLTLSRQYLEGAEETPTYADSALVLSREAEKLSITLKNEHYQTDSRINLAQAYSIKADHKQSVLLAQEIIEKLKTGNATLQLARAHALLGDNIPDLEKISKIKLDHYHQALNLFHQFNSKREEAGIYVKMANIYVMGGDYKNMKASLQSAQSIYDHVTYPEKDRDLQQLYERMQAAYLNFDNYTESLRYGLLSIRLVEKYKDSTMKAFRIYSHVGFLFGLLKQYDQQELYLNKSLPIAKNYEVKYKDSTKMSIALAQLVTLKLSTKKPGQAIKALNLLKSKYYNPILGWRIFVTSSFLEAYLDLKEYGPATDYYHILLKESAELDQYHPHQTLIYNAVIKYLVTTKQLDMVYKYLKLNDVTCQRTSQIDFLAKNHLTWFRVDSLNKKFDSAIKHYQTYKVISDSLLNAEKSKQQSNLQLSYQTEKKDKDIKLKAQNILLLTKQGQLQKVYLQREKGVRQIMIGGVSMMILLLALSYNRYRLKQRTNKKLELQQEKINKQNESLQQLLSEKEWLLKEIHHRVKNNLQIVISLLNTQSAYLDNEDALFAIKNSQHRMHAMSLIHQKLYQSENLATIDLSNYIAELVDYLKESFNTDYSIRYVLELEPLKLDVSEAVPIGLILNEAITNAIKYAFEKEKEGKITITLNTVAENTYRLCVADDGRGLPDNFDLDNSHSLGMSLMQGLTAQLEGTFDLKKENGLMICVTFKKQESIKSTTNLYNA